MRKLIFLLSIATFLFSQTESDIAFTAGYNKFDDPSLLRKHRDFYGIRSGVYQDNGYGIQIGYEQANGANCQGLNLKRLYINTLFIAKEPNGIKPYALLSAGYEISNIEEHKPSQLFIGAGAGIRKALTPVVNGFIEARVLRKLKSYDTDIITTVGFAYALDHPRSYYPQTSAIAKPKKLPSTEVDNKYVEKQTIDSIELKKEVFSVTEEKHYYVQMVALTRSNPMKYVQKLLERGIDNVEVKQITRRGKNMSLVVVGPFFDKTQAVKNLHKLKRISKGAFITKF